MVRIRALDDSGKEVAIADRQLPPGRQISLMDEELFSSSIPSAGWVLLESTVSRLAGFALMMNHDLTAMDGIAMLRSALREFVLPVWGDGEISLANPFGTIVPYQVELVEGTGQVRGRVEGTLAPRARRPIAARSLGDTASNSFVRASTGGVAASMTIRGERWLAAVAPQELASDAVGTTQYLTHFVSGSGYETAVCLINLEREAIEVQVQLRNDDGQLLGKPARIGLPAEGSATLAGASAFGLAADASIFQGYLIIDGSGHRFDGGALISSPRGTAITALSLQSVAVSEAILAHAVRDQAYWTGLALLNPGTIQATVIVQWFGPSGELHASSNLGIPPRGRWAGLLDQLMTNLSGSIAGYLRIQATPGIIPCALFGTRDGEAISAIPP
jgi:hypothetical protein